jgi:hypothetical protein
VSVKAQVLISVSFTSLVEGFIPTQRTGCKSPKAIEYYDGILRRFLWYASQHK